MTEEDRIVNILKRVGYEPDDLLYIISSHLHFDHAGGNGVLQIHRLLCSERNMRQHFIEKNI